MNDFISLSRLIKSLVTFILIPLFCSCAAPNLPNVYDASGPPGHGGYLSLYLNLQDEQNVPPLQMQLEKIEILSDSGVWININPSVGIIDAQTIENGQIFVARSVLQPGFYSHVRLSFYKPTLRQNNESLALALVQQSVELPIPAKLYVNVDDSHSLILNWDVEGSLQGNMKLLPVLSIQPLKMNLIADAAYVTCPDINTVYMLRTDLNRVYDSLGVVGGPEYLFTGTSTQQEDLYVLTTKNPGIKRIGTSVNRVLDSYNLPMTGGVAHMAFDPDGQRAFVVDRQRGTVSRISLQTGQVEDRRRVGYGPVFILYLEGRNLLAVSLSLSQTVSLLDPDTLIPIGSIPTGNRPAGLAFVNDSMLYIAESGSNSVQIYNLSLNKFVKRIPVDIAPERILASDGFIYVANIGSNSISLLRAGQLGVSRNVIMPGKPLELADVPANKWIYAGNEDRKSISIVDPVTSTVVKQIDLGCRPGGIAVVDR